MKPIRAAQKIRGQCELCAGRPITRPKGLYTENDHSIRWPLDTETTT